ncbi:competence protein ComJ [Peribacillus cavernae]|nr:competence protein ComJ [Peribacillus cavernae]MDQ0220185.1 hypothetical protein [Peribacillus cavernae]
MKKFPEGELHISYSQITVFNKGLENPYSDWTDKHINQGFVWREGTVSFGTLSDSLCKIEVILGGEITASAEAIRSIVVPFTTADTGITISSILSKEYNFVIPAGSYELLFEAFPLEPPSENDFFKVQYSFTFAESKSPKARILKHDGDLLSPETLLMTGEAAV